MQRWVFLLSPLLLLACGSSEGQVPSPGNPPSGDNGIESGTPYHLQERLPPPGRAWVIFGTDTVLVEVARTPEEREQGLMYRQELAEGEGMLFVFPDSRIRSFWMRNTFVPLDIAYLDEGLKVVDIQAMEAESEESHPSRAPAMFALEVPLGWFQKRGIGIGAVARIIFGPG